MLSRMWLKRNAPAMLVELQACTTTLEISLAVPQKIGNSTTRGSLNTFPGHILKENYVGKNWRNYDFTMVLSHFKGHPMGGFGGALKNVAIGMASSAGKAWIHTAGKSKDVPVDWENVPPQEDFLESMAEACESVFNVAGNNILYINVANNLSVDCDCVAEPETIKMEDIGILASLDPVALDRACVDMVYNSPDPGKSHLIERIESRNGTHLLDYAEELGLGSQKYDLITLDPESADE